MKKLYFFSLLFFTVFAAPAQQFVPAPGFLELQKVDGEYFFEEVVPVEGISSKELYTRGRQWYAEVFNEANEVLQMDDPEQGILIGKGWQDILLNPDGFASVKVQMWYLISVYTRDGRYKFSVSEIRYKTYPVPMLNDPGSEFTAEFIFDENNYYKGNGKPRKANENYYEATKIAVTAIANDLEKKMNTGISTATGEDW